MADGSFGSNKNRQINTELKRTGDGRAYQSGKGSFLSSFRYRVTAITPEHWVDIVFCSLFFFAGITIAWKWSSFMDFLFFNLLFPLICVGGKTFAIVFIIILALGILSSRFRRRRYW